MARYWNFQLPVKPNKGESPIDYAKRVALKGVARAVSEDPDPNNRRYLHVNVLLAEGSYTTFQATDGCRAHVATVSQPDRRAEKTPAQYRLDSAQLSKAVKTGEMPLESWEGYIWPPLDKAFANARKLSAIRLVVDLLELEQYLRAGHAAVSDTKYQPLKFSVAWKETLLIEGSDAYNGVEYKGRVPLYQGGESKLPVVESEISIGLSAPYVNDALQLCAWLSDVNGVPRGRQKVALWLAGQDTSEHAALIEPWNAHPIVAGCALIMPVRL